MLYNINSGYGHNVVTQALQGNAGKVFFVSSVTTSNIINRIQQIMVPDPDGVLRLYTTLNLAVSNCVAGRGDIIFVLPGHTETISSATALLLNIAGVTIVGLGNGASRPTFTLDTAATTRIPVSAANITFRNCIFINNFADIATVFLLTTAPGFIVDSCEFRDTSSILNALAIITTTVSVNADGLTFTNNKLSILGVTAATTPIKVATTMARITISGNTIFKAVLNNTSCLLAHAALVVTELIMERNRVFSANTDSATGGFLITTSATTNSGMVNDNYINGLDVAGAILVTAGSKYGMFNNLYDGDADASGFVLPAIGVN